MEGRLTRVINDLSTHSRQHHRHHHAKPRWLLSDGFSYVWWGQVVSQVGDGISKLALLLARVPGNVEAPLAEIVRRVADDPETHALLETIGDDERATLRWLRGMRDLLDHER